MGWKKPTTRILSSCVKFISVSKALLRVWFVKCRLVKGSRELRTSNINHASESWNSNELDKLRVKMPVMVYGLKVSVVVSLERTESILKPPLKKNSYH